MAGRMIKIDLTALTSKHLYMEKNRVSGKRDRKADNDRLIVN